MGIAGRVEQHQRVPGEHHEGSQSRAGPAPHHAAKQPPDQDQVDQLDDVHQQLVGEDLIHQPDLQHGAVVERRRNVGERREHAREDPGEVGPQWSIDARLVVPDGVDPAQHRVSREVVRWIEVRVQVVDGRDVAVHHVRKNIGGVQARGEKERCLEDHLEQHHHQHRAAHRAHTQVDQHDAAQVADTREDERQHERVHHDVQGRRTIGELQAGRQGVGQHKQLVQLLPHGRLADQVGVREVVTVGQPVAEHPDHDPADLHHHPGTAEEQQPQHDAGDQPHTHAGAERGDHYQNVTSFACS